MIRTTGSRAKCHPGARPSAQTLGLTSNAELSNAPCRPARAHSASLTLALRAFAPSRICQALAAIRKEAAATLRHTVCPWPSAGRPPRREHKPQIHATACSPASRRRQFASRGAQGSRSSACGPRPLLPLAPGFIILGASPRARLRPKRYAVASGCTLPAPPGEA